MQDSPVRVQRHGRVTVVSIDRQHARNAVDRQTALALADAFRAFEADAQADVAVLHGDHGTFCAGADLKALNDAERRNRTEVGDDQGHWYLLKPVQCFNAVASTDDFVVMCFQHFLNPFAEQDFIFNEQDGVHGGDWQGQTSRCLTAAKCILIVVLINLQRTCST